MLSESLKNILRIQEVDIKMIRLMRLKHQRLNELNQIEELRADVITQLEQKKTEIEDISNECLLFEKKIDEHVTKIKRLEAQQSSIKKIDEFNALTKETSLLEREKSAFEISLSNLVDKKNNEEETLVKINETLAKTDESNNLLQTEIQETIKEINSEGKVLLQEREILLKNDDPQNLLPIYEKLLRNKKDRVVVPIENRTCTGCNIVLTAQHENLVRKGDKIIFCEHCSRIHYWPEQVESSTEDTTTRKRRRRRTVATT